MNAEEARCLLQYHEGRKPHGQYSISASALYYSGVTYNVLFLISGFRREQREYFDREAYQWTLYYLVLLSVLHNLESFLEEGASVDKMPLQDWPLDKPTVYFLD